MAHVGRAYPLHFRRDLTLDVRSYVHGLARVYKFKNFFCTGKVGDAVKATPVNCFEVTPHSDELARWDSEIVVRGGRHVQFRFWIHIDRFPAPGAIDGELIDQSAGRLDLFSFFLPTKNEYQGIVGTADFHSVTDGNLWSVPPLSGRVDLLAVLWPEFNDLP